MGNSQKYLGETFRDLAVQEEVQRHGGAPFARSYTHADLEYHPSMAVVAQYRLYEDAFIIAICAGKDFTGQNFLGSCCSVSIVGTDEETIREYIRRQEKEDRTPRSN